MSVRVVTIVSFFIIILAPAGLFFYWRHTHRYIPPPPRPEINITIIPGWNLRQIASDWQQKDLIKSEKEFYYFFGEPAVVGFSGRSPQVSFDWVATGTITYLFTGKPSGVSLEGYFLPETYRVYADAKPDEVARKIINELDQNITTEMRAEIGRQGKNFFEILTMASVVEKEAGGADMGSVADIFWRRYNLNWALQSCATVNYITGKSSPAISGEDKQIDSPYNTYKYPGLPPGPISNPSFKAINAVIYPTKNDYWYFMSDLDGNIHYAETLDGHNVNVAKYLR